jgi:hypothetical protein
LTLQRTNEKQKKKNELEITAGAALTLDRPGQRQLSSGGSRRRLMEEK